MPVNIPKDIQRLVGLILAGKKLKKEIKLEPLYRQDEVLAMATSRLNFLNELANSEPIRSYLMSKEKCGDGFILMILDNFNSRFPQQDPNHNIGCLILRERKNVLALYDWVDADYPANRSESDYTRVTASELKKWDPASLKQFALLSEKQIWRNIKKWLTVVAIEY
jgi:hypothetical protein